MDSNSLTGREITAWLAEEVHSRGEDLRGKVSDVRGDGPSCQELSHLIGEGVAVVLKQTILVTSVAWRTESYIRAIDKSLIKKIKM